MLKSLDFLRELTLLSVIIRLLVATVSGGLIGLEREYKRRPAGFRTHILICLGACMTTLTSQFLGIAMGNSVELSRLGAQVVAGIGFIGAGTIIVTRQQRIKGLTTAAGLWVCAILGLAIGSGFLESALVTLCLILFAELFLVKLEYKLLQYSQDRILYVEYEGSDCLDNILSSLKESSIRINSMEITRFQNSENKSANAIFYIRANRKMPADALRKHISAISGVLSIEEL